MSRSERLLLLVFFVVVLVVLGSGALTSTAIGAVAGVVPAALVAGRLKRLSGRMDARLGVVEERRAGLRPRTVVLRAGLHLLVLGGLLLVTIVVPFVGDELFAASAAFVTAGAAVLTGWRLRR
jgi:membrane associated rhomboid family serine protease